MQTYYFREDELSQAGAMLAKGECVAFPTETVYGLGANALDAKAVQRIFAAKGRPSDNPLIVHIPSKEWLSQLVVDFTETSQKLMETFWPGPLTLVFKKSERVPAEVTAGLDTVAIRIPSHSWARAILKGAGVPIAAPSANRSGTPSATTWEAVAEDLDGRVAGIVCGPPTEIGLESTVVDATLSPPRILRPGKITYEELAKVVPEIRDYEPALKGGEESTEIRYKNSPGLRHQHYRPRARVILLNDCEPLENASLSDRSCYIGLDEPLDRSRYLKCTVVGDIESYGERLFDTFREADRMGADCIVCQTVPRTGLGTALMDRLTRAAG